MVQIDIQRDVIPVKIGTVELEFEATRENIKKLFDIYDNPEAFEEGLKDKFAEEVKALGDEEISEASRFSRMFDLEVKIARDAYDVLLGEGSFDKIYATYSDVNTLLYKILPQISESLGQEIGRRFEKEAKEQEKIKKAYLQKKRKKK